MPAERRDDRRVGDDRWKKPRLRRRSWERFTGDPFVGYVSVTGAPREVKFTF
jgi:hypothetical protein